MRRSAGYSSEDNRQWGPPLPNLPGAGVHGPMEPRAKGQTLKFVKGYPIAEAMQHLDPLSRIHTSNGLVHDIGPTPPYALHEAAQTQASQKEVEPREPGSNVGGARVPKWITYDKKVLGFGAYFREDVPYSALETWRVRKVTIKYYLESDQVEIVEAREQNSGLPQGVLLRRHSAVTDEGSALRWSELRVGGELNLYRRTYHLVSADAATRAFYREQGQEQPPDEAFPKGPIEQKRKMRESLRRVRSPTRHSSSSPQRGPHLPTDDKPRSVPVSPRGPGAVFKFMPQQKFSQEKEERDDAVLRFLGAWDNTAALFGDILQYSVCYHVSDGTIEVREVNRRNSGRDPFPLLLKRSRLPKILPPVFGRPLTPESRRLLAIPYYDWRDLHLGAIINVYGRKLMLYDCDEGTMAWLKKYVSDLTIEQLTPIQVDFDPFGPKRPPLSVPPNLSGIGSEEDSLQNVLRLVPRPVIRSYGDYLLKGDKVMRFSAMMVPLGPGRPLVGPHDADRRFIVSFYPVDGTMSVFEPRKVNSGMEQGAFLERTRVPNPVLGQPYRESDMQVGAILEVFGRGFQLLDADNLTFEYMEGQSYRFPGADYEKVLSKLTSWLELYPDQLPEHLKAGLAAADSNGSGYVTKYQLYDLLTNLGCDVTPHEVITLVRELGADRQGLLAEQFLTALGLAEAAPSHEPEPKIAEEPPPPQQQQQLTLSVPFPSPGLRTGAWPPFRRVHWSADPLAAAGQSKTPATANAAGAAAAPYSRIGPVPGHPRVDAPTRAQAHGLHFGYNNKGGRSSMPSPSGDTDEGGDGGDDRQHPRDTPQKAWRGGSSQHRAAGEAASFGSSWTVPAASIDTRQVGMTTSGLGSASRGPGGTAFLATGLKQPASLWQTTNMAWGGIGHAASYSKR